MEHLKNPVDFHKKIKDHFAEAKAKKGVKLLLQFAREYNQDRENEIITLSFRLHEISNMMMSTGDNSNDARSELVKIVRSSLAYADQILDEIDFDEIAQTA